MKVCVYARVSSERQAEKDLSIPSQLKALRRYAIERDWAVVAEYVDEAESARTANRPKFKEMVAAARRRSRPFDTILVWKLSRFARNREDSVIYKSLLKKHGVQVISINEPVDSSPAGKLLEGMIEVIDEFYSTNLAEDTLRGMRENAERGFHNGGHAPFGYEGVSVNVLGVEKCRLGLVEVEATVVRRVFQMALVGEGGKSIAKALNAEGLRTRSGKMWGITTVNYMLRNEAYLGVLVWTAKDGEVIRSQDAHPALVTREEFARVQQLMRDRRPRVRHPRTIGSQYLLSPLLQCSKCGAPMIGCTAKSGRFSYYRCNRVLRHGPEACPGAWLSKSKIEDFVINRLKERVLTEENLTDLVGLVNEEMKLLESHKRDRLGEIEKELESVNQKLLKYHLAFEKGSMSGEDAAPRIRELRSEQTRLQRMSDEALALQDHSDLQTIDAKQLLDYVGDLKDLLSKGTLMERKSFLRSFVKRIGFEPGQISIDYTIPMHAEQDGTCDREVLSIKQVGSPSWIRTNNLAVNSRPLYR